MILFTKRATQPMTKRSYWRIARALRDIAHEIEAACAGQTDLQKRALTARINSLAALSQHWQKRHRATMDLRVPEFDDKVKPIWEQIEKIVNRKTS